MNSIKMTVELMLKIKSLYDAGNSGLEISRILKGIIHYNCIVILKRANFNLNDYFNMMSKKNRVKIDSVPYWFTSKMDNYTKEEIFLAYKQFKKPLPMLDIIPCKCTNEKLCYAHYLKHLENIYVNGIKC